MAASNKPSRVLLLRPKQSLPKDRFQVYFNALRPQAYTESNTARGVANHKYVSGERWGLRRGAVSTPSPQSFYADEC